MRGWAARGAAAIGAVVLLATACQAPLEPASKREAAQQEKTPPEPSAATATPTRPVPTRPVPSAATATPPEPPPKPAPKPAPATPREVPVLGADASWPQCPKGMGIPQKRSLGAPVPLPQARFVVLGLTNGPGFVANPCLASQVAWVRERGLLVAAYSIISWPDAATRARWGSLEEVGRQQALYNVATMRAAGLVTPVVWLDVEPVPDFAWSDDTRANAEVVRGAARGYREAGFRIGVYSTRYLWHEVVGDLRLGLPEWRAAGQTSRREALARCGPDWSFQGGTAVLSQWVEAGRDQDVTCPRTSRELERWFHRS